MVRRIIEAKRFGKLRRLCQLRAQLVGDDVEAYRVGSHRPAQLRLHRFPVRRLGEREPIGTPQQNRVRAEAVALGDELHRAEVDRRQVQGVAGVWIPVDIGRPARARHCHSEVVEYGSAADQCLAPRVVGRIQHPILIEEQLNRIVLGYPAPRLAVVQRGRAAGQPHSISDDFGIRNRVTHDPSFRDTAWQNQGQWSPRRGLRALS